MIRLTSLAAGLVVLLATAPGIAQAQTTSYVAHAYCRLDTGGTPGRIERRRHNSDLNGACNEVGAAAVGIPHGGYPGCSGPTIATISFVPATFRFTGTLSGGSGGFCVTPKPWDWTAVTGGYDRNPPSPLYACPHGGNFNDGFFPQGRCLNAPACSPGKRRDPVTGECRTSPKNKGQPKPRACVACVANPVNAGTGAKYQSETVYRTTGNQPLVEQVHYNSQPLDDTSPLPAGMYGRGWKGDYERDLTFSVSLVVARRADGKEFVFSPTASGNVYVTDADTADRLERLTDGGGNTTGWKYTVEDDDSSELYGVDGRLLAITDRAGLALSFGYSDTSTPPNVAPTPGLLITVTDAMGRTLAYVYDAQRRVSRMTDPAGGTYDYTYDAAGNLSSITYPDIKVRSFFYNEPAFTQGAHLPNSLTGIQDENGARFATYQYDTQGRAVSSEHAGGAQKTVLDYATPGVATSVTDVFGVARTYSLATVLGAVKLDGITGPACPSCGPASQGFDANGNMAFRTDWNGNRTNFTWDLARNLEISRTEALTASGAPTPQTRTISTQWHGTFRLPTVVAEPLRITSHSYDASGNLLARSVQATTDANGSQGFAGTPSGSPRVWTYTYNANGQVLTMDGPRTDVPDVTTYTYYANNASCSTANGGHATGCRGQLESVTNALNQTTTVTEYNAHGQPLRVVDANGLVTSMAYDLRQRLTSRTVGTEATIYEYDFAGQLVKVTLPDASFLSYTYDAAHRLTSLQDNLGNRIAYTLDLAGNRTKEEVFDPTNALAQTRSRVYSNLNRLFQEIGAQSQTTEYAYDNQGNVTAVKDPLNRITSSQYDALNRLRQVTDANLGVTQYAYSGLDALTQVTDPRSLATSYTLNGLGDLTQQVSPDTGTTDSTYDAAGNLLTQTDAKGQTTVYAYDALNRVTLITFHDGSKQAYAYDQGASGVGRLSSIEERNAANAVTSLMAYGYDAHGRVTSETRTPGGVVAYQYDASGRPSGMTYPSGRILTYAFDALGRVSQVTTTKDSQSQVVVQNVAYQPFGGVKSYTLGNGQIYSRTIDLDGRIASYTLGGTTVAIGFDAASRITSIGANTYGYDTLDRLSSAILPSSNFGYSYDAVGNRLTKTVGANTDTYTYSSTSNRIATLTPASGAARSFVFDANGSTTDDAVNTYGYDVRGRMVQATTSQGTAIYQVNALGQRIRKTFGATDTFFTYDRGGRLIAESDPGGTSKREFIYLGDIPVGVLQ